MSIRIDVTIGCTASCTGLGSLAGCGVPDLVRAGSRLHGHLGTTGCGDDVQRIFRAIASIDPQIIGTGFGEGDLSLTVCVGSHGTGGGAKGSTIGNGVAANLGDGAAVPAHEARAAAQSYRQRLACCCGILMGDFLIIKEIMETKGGIAVKCPACIGSDIKEIAVIQHQLIGGHAPAVHFRILAVAVILQIAILKTKQAIFKEDRACAAADANIIPIVSHYLLVGIDVEMQCGELTVVVILGQVVFFQVNCLQFA